VSADSTSAIDLFLSRLSDVESSDGCWQATCPVCGCKRPGLRVVPGEGGFCRFRCYAPKSCRPADVLEALGLRWSDLDPHSYPRCVA
jgi:hypothetical protein